MLFVLMKIISWNIQGLNSSRNRNILSKIKKTNTTIVFLQETKCPSNQLQEISKKIRKCNEGIGIDIRGYVGALGILRDPNRVNLEGFHGNQCFISVVFKVIGFSVEGVVKKNYGPHNAGEKLSFINTLRKIHEENQGRH